MPECHALSNSLLSTSAGWISCGNVVGVQKCLGIDGDGKISSEDVAVRIASTVQAAVFIGTTKSCGAFSENSVLQDVDGGRWRAGDIVQRGSITDLKFEQVVKASSVIAMDAQTLWLAFAQSAAHQTNSELIIRCRTKTSAGSHRFGRFFVPYAERTYCSIEKEKFFKTISTAGAADLTELISIIFIEEHVISIPRESSELAMWAISQTNAQRPYRLAYDAIQYTSLIYLNLDSSQDAPLGDGRVAKRIYTESKEAKLEWRNSMWNPLLNGLIVS